MNKKKRWVIALLIAITAIFWTVPIIWGQQLHDTVSGVVKDANGPVAGAIVSVQNTPIQTTSAADGTFTLIGLTTQNPFTITAAAKGYYLRWSMALPGEQDVTIMLERHPVVDNNEGYAWQSAKDCGECHTAYQEWSGDAHGQSALNPRFLSMYLGTDVHGNKSPLTKLTSDGTYQPVDLSQPYFGPGFKVDFPNRQGNCAACHTPMASTLDTSNGCGWSGCHTDFTTDYSDQIPPAVNPTQLTGVAAEGINCDFCHKIGKVAINQEKGTPDADKPGILSVSLYRPNEGEELFFGSVKDVARPADSYLALQSESAFCAACHYGAITTTVVYNSFGEWLASPYSNPETGQTCQNCHMPPVQEVTSVVFPENLPQAPTNHFVFPHKGGLNRNPSQTHTHKMLGLNDEAFMKSAVKMQTQTALINGELQVTVTITNSGAGHHVPTDIPLRHLILAVQATDAAGNSLALTTGPKLPEWTGNYSGQAGKGYAKILKDSMTHESPTFAHWRPASIVEDTRIPAQATDTSQYTFTASANGPITVETKLVYRRAFQQLADWKGWNDPDLIMAQNSVTVEN